MKRVLASVTASLALAWTALPCCGAEEPKKDPPKVPAAEKDAAGADAPDIYKVPESSDATVLVTFSKSLLNHKSKNKEEQMAHQTKAIPVLKDVCTKILSIEKDETTDNGHFAFQTLVMVSMSALRSGPESPEFGKLVEQAYKLADSPKLDRNDIGMLMSLGNNLTHFSPEKGKVLYEKLAKSTAASKTPEVAAVSKRLEGVIRRLNLKGNTMTLRGKTFDGKDFDLASLAGKVVLIDFWATWCGPCRAELPNVKKNYEGYHNKGFEVVGVSGDRKPEDMDAFMKADPLPWPTLYEKTPEGAYKENEAMSYYGIMAFPTTILIGKDGKVLSLSARGPELGALLKAQLGEPEAPKEKAPEPAAPKDDKPANPAAPTK